MSDLLTWVINEMSSLLQFPVTKDMANCILMIESTRDLEDYLKSLLDLNNPTHQKFVKELVKKRTASCSQGYKKTELDNYFQTKPQDKKKKGNKGKKEKVETTAKKGDSPQAEPPEQQPTKKRSKGTNLLNTSIDEILLKGRHKCLCQASKHKLINNCLKCGRVVCEQEGSGPCFFCNTPVYTREEEVQLRLNKKPNNLEANEKSNSTLNAALELKNRLLEYDKTSEVRTRVIDDENDYFSSNSVWLSKEMKEELQKKEDELQRIKHTRGKVSLLVDFTGRCIDDRDLRKMQEEDLLLEEVTQMMDSTRVSNPQPFDIDPKSTITVQPLYIGDRLGPVPVRGPSAGNLHSRVQDKELIEMSDQGMCLSMHQPWASLLIAGIKEHEGRTWYTYHRGRLWIAATAKQPTKEDIDTVQNQYRLIKGDHVKMPSKYPTSCLLGCVTLSECLAQEDYLEKYPTGESDAPFVFVCTDPTPCPVLFPIKGQHKIYKLESKIHQAAVKCIQKMAKINKEGS